MNESNPNQPKRAEDGEDPLLEISHTAYAPGGSVGSGAWRVFLSGCGFRVRRTIWDPFGFWPEPGPREEAHEGDLSGEALAQVQAALEPIWQDPKPGIMGFDVTITTIRSGNKS